MSRFEPEPHCRCLVRSEAAPALGSLVRLDSPYLSDRAWRPDLRDDSALRSAELAAASPFTVESTQRESPFGGLPARIAHRILDLPKAPRAPNQATCEWFLASDSSTDYEKYVAAPSTGLMTPFINGRYWGGAKPRQDQFDAFNAMQQAVEGLKAGEWLLLAAWMFDPTLALTKTNAVGVNAFGNKTWGDLVQRKASEGVKIRLLVSDFSSIFKNQYDPLYNVFLPALDQLIAGLPTARRDNLKYVVSLHGLTTWGSPKVRWPAGLLRRSSPSGMPWPRPTRASERLRRK
jgi:hypothetical protein